MYKTILFPTSQRYLQILVAQSVGAVEYTDCNSAEG